jgi:hypothetical protein
MGERLLTLAETATILRLNPITLQALAAAAIPALKLGRAWRSTHSDERTGARHATPAVGKLLCLLSC